MTVNEAIEKLRKAKRQLGGDTDLVYVTSSQFADINDITAWRAPTSNTAWVWAGPVVVIELSTD